jgi:hypothetical protein
MAAIPIGTRWNLRVVLICISFMVSDINVFLAIWTSSFEKVLSLRTFYLNERNQSQKDIHSFHVNEVQLSKS